MIGASKDRAIYNKLVKLCNENRVPCCPIYHNPITTEDNCEAEYIKTKRGTEIFIHTECVKNWGN